jgi:putative Mg2+ transporter-C (MgtC) family protein
MLAGGLIGLNRGERGQPAGLRTTLLVCLAASIAMIQANLLMNTVGKTPDSFISLDLMRLPLGILSGMGFIGAGAIMRRDDLVLGVTTAATLWFTTVVGLCLGGGQLVLGLVALALGLIVLECLKWVEKHIRQRRRATLILTAGGGAPTDEELRSLLSAAGFQIGAQSVTYAIPAHHRRVQWEVEWRSRPGDARLPGFLQELAQYPNVTELEWKDAFRS